MNTKQGIRNYNPNELANPTQGLREYDITNMNTKQGIHNYNPSHLANPTQELSKYEITNMNTNKGIRNYNPNELANPTQELSRYDITNMNTNKGISNYNPTHLANPTQCLQEYDITNLSGKKVIQAHLSDIANITSRQTTNTPFNTFISQDIGSKIHLQDNIRETIKQTHNYNNHLQPVSNQTLQSTMNVSNWDTEPTLKDKVKVQNYVGSIGLNCENVNEMNFRNANTNIIKEELFKSREPTTSNCNQGPNIELINNIKLNNELNFSRMALPTKSNKPVTRIINQEIKIKSSYDDRIEKEILEILSSNKYVNNVIYELNKKS
jgi:hypothetical protein